MKRRELLTVPAALAASGDAKAQTAKGWGLYPMEGSNPLGCKVVAMTTVSPDVQASVAFYNKVMGFDVLEEGQLDGANTAPGAGKAGRRYVLIGIPNARRGATIRVLEAPPGATPIRPRGDGPDKAEAWDPGLLVMEGGGKDPCESYRVLKNAGTPMISPPRYYFFRAEGTQRDLDVMSYAPFGPGGEQLFITCNLRSDRPEWTERGLHTAPGSVSVVGLDQRPIEEFYSKAFGLKRTSQMDAHQKNCNELVGAPDDAYFLWGRMGDASFEIWEWKMPSATPRPCSLDKTGLASFTLQVNDLEKCRAMCREAGIRPVGEGAFPLPSNAKPKGFTLRGGAGELVEVIQA
jgi:predicted enzyme related to lactoylglutathione lyase